MSFENMVSSLGECSLLELVSFFSTDQVLMLNKYVDSPRLGTQLESPQTEMGQFEYSDQTRLKSGPRFCDTYSLL